MERITNATFANEQIAVDNKHFNGCTFTNVTLVYGAGAIPAFENCTFDNISLEFAGAADKTLQFISRLSESGFNNSVETIFDAIRGA